MTDTDDTNAHLQRLELAIRALIKMGEDQTNIIGRQFFDIHNRLYVMEQKLTRPFVMAGKIAAARHPPGVPIYDLAAVEFQVFSQWGEDGIIEWLVANLPDIPHRFVEFGAEDFSEANCLFLLQNRNWSGLIFDGSGEHIEEVRRRTLYWRQDLTAKQAFITAENIESLLEESGFLGPLGILSIDIDGNDYRVWEAIRHADPAIVIVEYNAILGDLLTLSVPYDPSFSRLQAHYSGQYFGASIAALKYLGQQKGYTLLGTNSNGVNAFFVRDDLVPGILPLIQHRTLYPSRHRDSRNEAGQLTFTGGMGRYDLIRKMPVVDVRSGWTASLEAHGQAYSQAWAEGKAAEDR